MAAEGAPDTAEPGEGRDYRQLRGLMCEKGLLQRADGSARWTQEGTSMLAAVYGPQAAAGWKEDPEKAVVEVVFKPRSGLAGELERQYEHYIRCTIEGVVALALFPRTVVSVTLQVVSQDGSVLACALNAACAALVDAGVPMTQLFACVTCGLTEEGLVLIDPDSQAEQAAAATVCFSFPVRSSTAADTAAGAEVVVGEGVLTCLAQGHMAVQQYLNMLDIGRQACERIAHFSRLSIEKSFRVGKAPTA